MQSASLVMSLFTYLILKTVVLIFATFPVCVGTKIGSNNVDVFFPEENDVWRSVKGIRELSVLFIFFTNLPLKQLSLDA